MTAIKFIHLKSGNCMAYTNVLQMGNKQQELLNNINFYEKEIDFMRGLLTEVASKNTSMEVRGFTDHFENQFTIQQHNIEESRKRIQQNRHLAALEAQGHSGKVETEIITDQHDIEKEVEGIEKVILGLRAEFKRFLVKWM